MERGSFSQEELPLQEWLEDYEERVIMVAHDGLSRILELIRSEDGEA